MSEQSFVDRRNIENARIVAWLREARAGFIHDREDGDFQLGYKTCIELALTEGAQADD